MPLTPEQMEAAQGALDDLKGDLHPDLVPFIEESNGLGLWVKHPLVVSMYHPGFAGWINRAYAHKQKALARAMDDGNARSFVWLHERPYRPGALRVLETLGLLDLDTAEAWQLIGAIWIDSEFVDQEDKFWRRIWLDPRARSAMTAEEHVALAELPDPIHVWHGLERKRRDQLGYSWTSSQDVATWFGYRMANLRGRKRAWLADGVVSKADVRAYLLGRGEFEIIVDPKQVRQLTTVTLAPRTKGDS